MPSLRICRLAPATRFDPHVLYQRLSEDNIGFLKRRVYERRQAGNGHI